MFRSAQHDATARSVMFVFRRLRGVPRGFWRQILFAQFANKAEEISDIEGKAARDNGERVRKGASFKSVALRRILRKSLKKY
jgi:hypothetical protein